MIENLFSTYLQIQYLNSSEQIREIFEGLGQNP